MDIEQLLALLAALGAVFVAALAAGAELQKLRHAVEKLQDQFCAVQKTQAEQAAIHDDLQAGVCDLEQQMESQFEQLREQLSASARAGQRFGPMRPAG